MENIETSSLPEQKTITHWQRYSWLLATLVFLIICFLSLLITGNSVLQTGTSKGSTVSIIAATLAVLLTLVVVRLLPLKLLPYNFLSWKDHRQIVRESQWALGYALLVPLLLGGLGLIDSTSESSVKALLLFIGIGLFLWIFRKRNKRDENVTRGEHYPTSIWYWLGPVIVGVFYLAITSVSPFALRITIPTPALFSPLFVAFVLQTLLIASIPEELFYRFVLQTRLEGSLGRWNGIAVASLLFGLMHLPSRFVGVWLGKTGNSLLDFFLAIAAVVVFQGMGGVLLGYVWSRYRNIWLNILLHTLLDTWPIVLVTLTLH